MHTTSELFAGIMSGTSLDGIDIALVDFAANTPVLQACFYQPYPAELRQRLQSLIQDETITLAQLIELDAELGECYALALEQLLKREGINAESVCAAGCHGQTLLHLPHATYPSTLQIGDANRIAQRCRITTVADFRRRDMAAGGQGAPLVPAFHHYLFNSKNEQRVIVNIGGIANITLLPGEHDGVRGFDTGPGNTLLDYWCQQHLHKTFDQDGQWSATGQANANLLAQLLKDNYFLQSAPKSTGTDYFSPAWLRHKLADFAHLSSKDVQATLLRLTVQSIADAILAEQPGTDTVIVCGGGAHNKHIMQSLQRSLVRMNVVTSQSLGYDPDHIEAMAFAWLARQTLRHQAGNLPAVTGAKEAVILGAVYPVWPGH